MEKCCVHAHVLMLNRSQNSFASKHFSIISTAALAAARRSWRFFAEPFLDRFRIASDPFLAETFFGTPFLDSMEMPAENDACRDGGGGLVWE